MSDKAKVADVVELAGEFMAKLGTMVGGPVGLGLGLMGALGKGGASLLRGGASVDEIMASAKPRPKVVKGPG